VLRSAVGFLVFFAAFAFKDDVLALGVVGGMALVGGFVGNLLAPILREQKVREERILSSALLATAVAVLLGGLMGGTFGFVVASLMVGMGAAAGRIGFDSLLQRDGPDAARGRAFAKFETRFQIAWVAGALFGLLPVGERVGLLGFAAVLLFAGLSYLAALRAARTRPARSKLRPDAVDRAMTRVWTRTRAEIRVRYENSQTGRRRSAAKRRRAGGTPGASTDSEPTVGEPPAPPGPPSPGATTRDDDDPFPGGS
jgi:MFS family permease